MLTLRTDSIHIDVPQRYFRYYGTQKIDRRSSTITRSLITEGIWPIWKYARTTTRTPC